MQLESPLKTKEDTAFEELEKLILLGALPQREFLSQRMLAGKVGTSLISVRGALRRLENIGLIENVPHWGVRIPHETKEDVQDRYYLREILELAAVRRIRENSNAAMMTKLLDAAKACDGISTSEPENIEKFAQLHYDLHRLIAEGSGSPSLAGAASRLNRRSLMLWNASRGWARGYDRVAHSVYIDAIFGSDLASAEDAVKDHLQRGMIHELDALAG